jgi:hypothetical protein
MPSFLLIFWAFSSYYDRFGTIGRKLSDTARERIYRFKNTESQHSFMRG